MSKYFIISCCCLCCFNFAYAQTKGSPNVAIDYPKQFAPKGAIPQSQAYFQTDLLAIKKLEAQMQVQTLGGVEDSPNYLQPGSIVLFKTNAGNFGKMQILSFGQQNGHPAELYMRYTLYNTTGNILRTNEFIDLSLSNVNMSKSRELDRGYFELDHKMVKSRNGTKRSFIEFWEKDSTEYTKYSTFMWKVENNLLFIVPNDFVQYLVKNNEVEFKPETPSVSTEPLPPTGPKLQPQRRLALVIGNTAYPTAPLRNPVNDATDITAALREIGFEVITTTNANRQKMDAAIDDFGTRLKNYNLGFFYYAGHGVQIDGENYLIPVDAKLKTQGEVKYECYPIGKVLAKMEEAAIQANVIVLDACRDNPFSRSWSRSLVSGGLANINAPQGTFIGFATAPGSTAADGEGRNGVYTSALLEHLRKPKLTLDQIFNAVSGSVKKKTNNQQVPWKASSMSEDLYLRN